MNTVHHEEKRTHQFRHPKREWKEFSCQLFIDRRVLNRVDFHSIEERVVQIIRAHKIESTRIEVVPYQWVWDENFVSVGIAFETTGGTRYFVYSLKEEQKTEIKILLAPFEGHVAY